MARSVDLPWFPMWAQDFQGSRAIKEMSSAAVGLCTLMLCQEWTDGPLPPDPDRVATLIGRSKKEVRKHWPELLKCFHINEFGLVSARLESEREKQEVRHHKRVVAGRQGGRPPKAML